MPLKAEQIQEILESWGRIKIELDNIKDRNEFCLIIGDFNRALGAGKFRIEGNKPNVFLWGKVCARTARER